jgi:hypothetical protein
MDITCQLKTITRKIQNTTGDPSPVTVPSFDTLSLLSTQVNTVSGWLQILPYIVITTIMLVLCFLILIQFVTRYLTLYLLFVLYPVAAVFWFHDATANYYRSYWKQVITFLIYQPIFLITLAIFTDLSQGLASDFTSLPNLLIFTIFLAFLTTVPGSIASRIFADAYAFNDTFSRVASSPIIQNISKPLPMLEQFKRNITTPRSTTRSPLRSSIPKISLSNNSRLLPKQKMATSK